MSASRTYAFPARHRAALLLATLALLGGTACNDAVTGVEPTPNPEPNPGAGALHDLVYEETTPGGLQSVRLRVRRADDGAQGGLFGLEIMGASPTVSADGKTVVYVGAGSDPDGYDYQDLWRVRRGGQPERVALSTGRTEFAPSLSPDGQRIAFVRLADDGHTRLVLANVDGSQEQELSFAVAPGLQQAFAGPAWSPDGRRLLFSAGAPGALHLWMVDADGRRLVQLTEAAVSDIDGAWSPDGKQVAFVRSASPAQGRLMVLDVQAGTERDFGYAWRNRQPAFSPDGARIAFVSNMHDNADLELYLVNVDGGGLTRLTDDDLRQQQPRWIRRP